MLDVMMCWKRRLVVSKVRTRSTLFLFLLWQGVQEQNYEKYWKVGEGSIYDCRGKSCSLTIEESPRMESLILGVGTAEMEELRIASLQQSGWEEVESI